MTNVQVRAGIRSRSRNSQLPLRGAVVERNIYVSVTLLYHQINLTLGDVNL